MVLMKKELNYANEVTSLDAAMTLPFHFESHQRARVSSIVGQLLDDMARSTLIRKRTPLGEKQSRPAAAATEHGV